MWCIKTKRLVKKKWDTGRTENSTEKYRKMKYEVEVEVLTAKQSVYDDLYDRLDKERGES